MLRFLLLSTAALLASCARVADPNVTLEPGTKAVLGSFKINNVVGHQPDDLFLFVAPVTRAETTDGKPLFVVSSSTEMYTVKSAWQRQQPNQLPFFIPLKPGIYAIKGIRYEYGGRPIMRYNISFGNGASFEVDANADATYLGRIVVITNSVDMREHKMSSTIRVESENEVKSMFLEKHPGLTIKDDLMAVRHKPAESAK
jgi:hypothetical protein